jgi:hypothetical protein
MAVKRSFGGRRAALVLSLLSGLALAGGGPAGAEPDTGVDAAPAADLSRLAWLSGHWRGEHGDIVQEEWWTDSAGGMMLGLHRDLLPDGRVAFEYLRIETRGDGIVYVASPSGGAPTGFRAVLVGPDRVVFENPAHDFPQRILYEKDGGDGLVARIGSLEDPIEEGPEWRWRRVR